VVLMRSGLFWDVTRLRLVGTDVSVQVIGPVFKCQRTNHKSMSRSISEEQKSHRSYALDLGASIIGQRMENTICGVELTPTA
jgi:hypothetical protein